jgi:EmrB/QacA subfamily drug resistance transporter
MFFPLSRTYMFKIGSTMPHHSPLSHPESEPSGPAVPRRWLALVLLCLAQFMLILDITVINIALPDLSSEIGLVADSAGWVITAYAIPFAGLMLLGGRMTDRFGTRRLFLIGLLLFTTASLAAGIANSAPLLLAARALQGTGAALLSPAALATVTRLFTGSERHRALALWGAIGGVGAATGVLLGGLITAGPGWRWIFFINVPVGIIVAATLPLIVPAAAGAVRRLDLAGGLLATLATGTLIAAISRAGGPFAWPALLVAAILFAMFFWQEKRAAQPLFDLYILRRRPVRAGATVMLVATGLLVGAFFLLSFVLQRRLGWSPLSTGLAFLPVAVGTLFGAHLSGHLIGHLGGRLLAAGGFALAALGFGLAFVQLDMPVVLVAGMAITALGLGLTFVAATTTALSEVMTQEAGLVAGFINTCHELGGALGVAAVALVASASLAVPAMAGGFTRAFASSALVAVIAALVALLLMPAGRPAPGTARFVH